MKAAERDKKAHPVTFLDERTLKIEPNTRLGKTIFKAISNMARAKFNLTEAPNIGMKVIFDEPLAKRSRSYEREGTRD